MGFRHIVVQMVSATHYSLKAAFLKTPPTVRGHSKAGRGEEPPIAQFSPQVNWRSFPLDLLQH